MDVLLYITSLHFYTVNGILIVDFHCCGRLKRFYTLMMLSPTWSMFMRSLWVVFYLKSEPDSNIGRKKIITYC